MFIDSHQHFWKYSAADYPWLGTGMEHLRRDFLPADLDPLIASAGFTHSVAVQARQTLDETRWLLELADAHPGIYGVVGWVDLRSPAAAAQLAMFAANSRFLGVRHVVQDEQDDRFLLGADFIRGLQALPQYGLTYDLLIFPRQLPAAIELVRRLPNQPFVLDHIAKPRIREGLLQPWTDQIRELAESPNVMCKVSGMVTEAAWRGWSSLDFRPYLEVVFDAFGVDRVMYGSDWPVCLAAAEYAEVVGLVRDYVQEQYPDAADKFFGLNAAAFYQRRGPR
ncbi:MAG: amidohydrolase family protein [Planctomycetaceae bacterium]|nr:amidohydrolase family protein [Planctomycetaceae bacterium]